MTSTRTRGVAALVLIGVGLFLSRLVHPNVRVESMWLGGDIPTLRFTSVSGGPHPNVLLAHGVTASKETLFRLGEALAACGCTCYAIDLPGHGASTRRFIGSDNASVVAEAAGSIGPVDVYVGHSMGAYAGAQSVRDGRLHPRLFIALGAWAEMGANGPPLLLLAGRYEEALSVGHLRAYFDKNLVVSPWSDHALEPYDPCLVDAAVAEVCRITGLTPVAAGPRWCWRLLGVALAVCGAALLGSVMPQNLRGLLLAVLTIAAFAATSGSLLGVAPHLRRVPVQAMSMGVTLAVVAVAARIGIPRWSFAALAAAWSLVCLCLGEPFAALFAFLFTLVCLGGTALGYLSDRGGEGRTQGDIASAVLVGYALGQWAPLYY